MFRVGSRRERRAWRGGRMSKVWGGGRGGCVGGFVVVVSACAVVVVGVAFEDMVV